MSNSQSDTDFLRMKVITAFRLGKEGEGCDAMVKFMDCLQQILNDNIELLGSDEAILIKELLAAQRRGDYIFVADLLEYLLPTTVIGKVIV